MDGRKKKKKNGQHDYSWTKNDCFSCFMLEFCVGNRQTAQHGKANNCEITSKLTTIQIGKSERWHEQTTEIN